MEKLKLGGCKLLKMERETGIEPATNSLEGCDSTIELLPLVLLFNNLHRVPMDRTGQNGARWTRFAPNLHQIARMPEHDC